jgi:hypothetical protein
MRLPPIALLLLLALGGCTRTLDQPAGRYQGLGDLKTHSLALEAGGDFRHAWTDAVGAHEERGRWSVGGRNASKAADDACLWIDFEGYTSVGASRGIEQACGLRDIEGGLLVLNDDKRWAYRKQ